MIHVQTVDGRKKGYTKQEIVQTKQAKKAQAMIGNPSKKGMVSNHLVTNCPVTHANNTNTRQIFGPDQANIWGKTVQRAPEPVGEDYVAVPQT